MQFALLGGILLLAAAGAGRAQDPPPPAPAPAAPAGPPVFEYTGKPIVLPLRCTTDDLDALGLTCSEDEPCAVYLDLTAAGAAGALTVAIGNLHAAAVTMFSTILGSEDGGRTWRELHGRIRGAGFEHLQFVNPETGWVGGEFPNPLPRDPFVLLTTDGGKTWRRRAVFAEDSENNLGAIQQLYFSSKTEGSLVIDRGQGSESDRYELYESPNGGESWTLKQTSRAPLQIRRAAGAPASVRVNVDGPSQSLRIETRQGERWAAVAAFAIKLPACKPEE